jgi:hypothetical protein
LQGGGGGGIEARGTLSLQNSYLMNNFAQGEDGGGGLALFSEATQNTLLENTVKRPAVQRGLAVGKDFSSDPATLSPEETERRAKLLYNQRARPTPQKHG